eukprot:scaffold4934_cov128-Isochrysis_galbana.AAC.6
MDPEEGATAGRRPKRVGSTFHIPPIPHEHAHGMHAEIIPRCTCKAGTARHSHSDKKVIRAKEKEREHVQAEVRAGCPHS